MSGEFRCSFALLLFVTWWLVQPKDQRIQFAVKPLSDVGETRSQYGRFEKIEGPEFCVEFRHLRSAGLAEKYIVTRPQVIRWWHSDFPG